MKKLILLACAAVLSITMQAQQIMVVETKDNTQNEFIVSSIRKVRFRSSDENPADPTANLSCPDERHPHLIDLGLPSGTRWSCCNVGATTPEDYGGYYAWGETVAKLYYDWDSYSYYDVVTEQCADIGNDIASTDYDVATAKWDNLWRMPSAEMFQELIDNCTWTWISQNDADGYLVTSSNGGAIFLPAAGGRVYEDIVLDGIEGDYWASTLYPEMENSASCVMFRSSFYVLQSAQFFIGFSVRPVSK